eukprot:775590-Pyramimonas_sp.AAC.1
MAAEGHVEDIHLDTWGSVVDAKGPVTIEVGRLHLTCGGSEGGASPSNAARQLSRRFACPPVCSTAPIRHPAMERVGWPSAHQAASITHRTRPSNMCFQGKQHKGSSRRTHRGERDRSVVLVFLVVREQSAMSCPLLGFVSSNIDSRDRSSKAVGMQRSGSPPAAVASQKRSWRAKTTTKLGIRH